MPGIRYILITKDCKVIKISKPRNFVFSVPKEIINENVLLVELLYETVDGKPYDLFHVSFMNIQMDGTGLYDRERDIVNDLNWLSQLNYFCFENDLIKEIEKTLSRAAGEEYIENKDPLPIPIIKYVPKKEEIEALKNYIKNNMPQVNENGLRAINIALEKIKKINDRKIEIFKDSHKKTIPK